MELRVSRRLCGYECPGNSDAQRTLFDLAPATILSESFSAIRYALPRCVGIPDAVIRS